MTASGDEQLDRTAGEPDGPIVQSLRIVFRGLVLATCVLAAAWLASNVRQVPAGSQAVVVRFGAVTRIARSGLAIALPRPFEAIELLPGPDARMEFQVAAGGASGPALVDPAAAAAGQVPPANAAAFLTGDGGVVAMNATLTWRIANPAEYYLARDHVAAALRRLYLSTATAIAAAGGLDDFLVARADRTARSQNAREALRGAIAAGINRRLAVLARSGTGLGVEVARADIDVLLPPSAKIAFDQVLDATQMAEQSIAAARTEATRTLQTADRARDKILTDVHAAATERIDRAHAIVAPVDALGGRPAGPERDAVVRQVYLDRVATILHQAGSVSTVDPEGGRLILPSGPPLGTPRRGDGK